VNTTIITAAIAAAIGFGAAWRIQAGNITEMEAADATRRVTESSEAFRRLERDTAQIATAQGQKVARDAVLRADAGRAASAGGGLRLASADTVRAAQADSSACFESIARYDIVLSSMVTAGEQMAETADRWASDAVMLHDAWPK